MGALLGCRVVKQQIGEQRFSSWLGQANDGFAVPCQLKATEQLDREHDCAGEKIGQQVLNSVTSTFKYNTFRRVR